MIRQRPEDGCDIGFGDTGVLGEVGRLLRDLGSGRRHEVVEQPGGDVLLRRLQRREGALEVVGDDPAAAAEPVEGLDAELVPAGADLDLPQPLHHELEERRLDPRRPVRGRTLRLGGAAGGGDPADGDLVEHSFDERRLDRHGWAAERRQALERAEDRALAGTTVEAIEAEVVAEDVRDQRLEPIELGERVLADRDEHVDPQRRRHELGQLPLEGAGLRVVEEVLLRLIEDEVDIAIGGRAPHSLDEPVPTVRPAAVETSSASASEGSSPQRANTTTSGCSGSSRSDRATPARSSDDLPTPLGP